jgi:ABC-type nitrate/sulfonate/bicarbonate transport system substrate-binding protein
MNKFFIVIAIILIGSGLFLYKAIFPIGRDDVLEQKNNFPSGIQDNQQSNQLVKIGYFHGGRTALLMRAYENHEFEKAGLAVEFYSKELYGKEYSLVPQSIKEFNKGGTGIVGKVRGTELINAMLEGKFDLATPGEFSFVFSICTGKPVIAIAELGHDVKKQSGHVFLMRKGIEINKPDDYRGKVLVSRRAGPGDSIFLKEFLEYKGFNLEKDIVQLEALPKTLEKKRQLPQDKVIIVDQLFEDKMRKGIKNGVIDGGYFHLMSVPRLSNSFNIIQPLQDWANPELSHALLVCTKEFLQANRERLIPLLETYIKRIKYEHSLSYEERTKPQEKGLQMAINFYGLNYPQYDIVPTVDVDLLYEIMNLLRKYKFIGKENIKIEDFVDNSLVLEALNNLGISEKDDYWQSEY